MVIKHRSSLMIYLRRGVKQGDPLSLYIFNAIMNPLLEQQEALQGYTIDGNHHIMSLAFADDLILLAENQDMAQNLLSHTALNLQKIGMTIAADKCAEFRVVTIKDAWYISETQLFLTHSCRAEYYYSAASHASSPAGVLLLRHFQKLVKKKVLELLASGLYH